MTPAHALLDGDAAPAPQAHRSRHNRGTTHQPANAARIHDYLLGGAHTFAPDRAAAEELLRAIPAARTDAWADRAFRHRAVTYLRGLGVRQFLDLGSGIAAGAAVHDLAQRQPEDARVVYVDADPVVVELTRRALADTPGTAVLHADLCDPHRVLNSPEVADLLDFSHPVGLIMTGVLHFVPDTAGPAELIGTYGDAVAEGSCLVLSHATPEGLTPAQRAAVLRAYEDTGTPLTLRSPQQVAGLLDGYRLFPATDAPPGHDHLGRCSGAEPAQASGAGAGLVPVHRWRPDPLEPEVRTRSVYGAVALLRAAGRTADPAAARSAAPVLPAAPVSAAPSARCP